MKTDAQGQTGTKLPVAMTGKASAAKAAEGPCLGVLNLKQMAVSAAVQELCAEIEEMLRQAQEREEDSKRGIGWFLPFDFQGSIGVP